MSTAEQFLTDLQTQFGDLIATPLPGLNDPYAKFYNVTITTDRYTGEINLHLLAHSPLQETEHATALSALVAKHRASLTRDQSHATTAFASRAGPAQANTTVKKKRSTRKEAGQSVS